MSADMGGTFYVYFSTLIGDVATKRFDTLEEANEFADEVWEGGAGFGIWHESPAGVSSFVSSRVPKKGAHEEANSQRVAQGILPTA